MSRRTRRLLAAYLATVAATLMLLGLLVVGHRGGLLRAAVDAVLPDGLVDAGGWLAEGYIRDHLAASLSLLVTVLVAVVPAFTFWLKEWLSASWERDCHPEHPPHVTHPLWRQGLDEAILLLIMLALALGAYRVAVTPGYGTLGAALANVVMAATFAVDFIGPTLMRRGCTPVDVYRVMFARHPLRSMVFGGVFALPALGAAKLALVLSPTAGAVALVAVHTAVFGAAVLVGTRLATPMRFEGAWPRPVRGGVLVGAAALFAYNGAYFGGAVKAAYHVSPVLKCDWSLVGDTLDFEWPSLWDPALGVRFDVEIYNPTGRTARVDDGAIVSLTHRGDRIAAVTLPPFDVPPGERVRRPIAFDVRPEGGLLSKGAALVREGGDKGWWETAKAAAGSAVDREAYAVWLTVPLPTGELRVSLYGGAAPPK